MVFYVVRILGFSGVGGWVLVRVVMRLLVVRVVIVMWVGMVVLVMWGVSMMLGSVSSVGLMCGLFLKMFRFVVVMCCLCRVVVRVFLLMMLLWVMLISVVVGFISVSLVVVM